MTTINKTQAAKQALTELRKPLPPEAIKPHPTKSYLSQINAIYVVERLNDVFGLGRWKIEHTIIKEIPAGLRSFQLSASKGGGTREEYCQAMPIVMAKFTAWIPESESNSPEIYIEAFGGNDNDDLGDAYKGACTDALTKIGSYLGIGADVWKDTSKKNNQEDRPAARTSTQGSGSAAPANQPPAKWVDRGTPEWKQMVIEITKNIGEKGGSVEDWLRAIRNLDGRAVNSKDRPELITEVAQTMKGGQQ
jgi:hypothetical protein